MTKHKKVAAHHHENLKSHAKALVNATTHITEGKVDDARNKLSEIIDAVSDSVERVENAAMEKVKQADEFVQENPYKTAAIALGLGALIGFLISRRGESNH